MDDTEPDNAADSPEPTTAKLPQDFQTKFTDYINKKAVSPTDACPVCGSHLSVVGDHSNQIPTRMEPDTIFSTSFMPVLTTVCYNCGFVRFFSENIVRQNMKGEQGDLPRDEPEGNDGG